MTTNEFVEKYDVYLMRDGTRVPSKYKSFTSNTIAETNAKYKPAEYSLSKLIFTENQMLLEDLVVFSFFVTDQGSTRKSGRAIYIDIDPTNDAGQLKILKTAQGHIAMFEYPGINKTLKVLTNNEWQIVSPIVSNIVYLPYKIKDIQEIAIFDDNNSKLLGRTINENSFTTKGSTT